ncbi:phage portal protein [Testudinibacter sp. P80/BLE/0925]
MFWSKKKKIETQVQPVVSETSYWLGNVTVNGLGDNFLSDKLSAVINQNNALMAADDFAMDGEDLPSKLKLAMPEAISIELANWYASQSFIGYQMCALLSQNWLINKACSMPARDATRNGYDIITTDGTDMPDKVIKKLQRYDKKYRLRWNAEQFVRMGRIFGIRIALFDIESTDPEFYEKPFNIDGVTRGSYKGIVQVDPYWCTPMLVGDELSNPAGRHFYEPTYWQINGKKYHRSHLFIFRNNEVPDIIKPMYLYGGLPVPQLIMERVYGAERTASESLGLVVSKRTSVWLTNMAMFMADAESSAEKFQNWIKYRDNYAIKLGDREADQFQQFDTALGDLDEVIMTQYQLVAAASGVPATKLLGTAPKGFNSTGESEEKSYHEELESIQEHDLTELVERHHQLVMKSFCDEVLETTINWRPTDSPSSQQIAERNKLKADTYSSLVMSGAIDGKDVRYRLSTDPDSGFHDMGDDDSDDDLLSSLGFSPDEIQATRELGIGNETEADRGEAVTGQ